MNPGGILYNETLYGSENEQTTAATWMVPTNNVEQKRSDVQEHRLCGPVYIKCNCRQD